MPPFIALELILCILRHLPSYLLHDLNNCALVCRSWAPHARSFAFRAIRLSSAEHTIELIDLLTSPHETISAAIKYINIEGWFGDHVFSSLGSSRAIKPDAGKILKAFTTASERSLSFPHVKRLNLEKIEWGSVSPSVRKAFMDHNPFQSLVWLRLSSCSFETYAQYWELIHSFPLLESYDHGDCIYIPFKSVDCVTSPKPLRLRALHWHVTYVPRAMEAWPDAAVFNALLLESGESLEELEFIVEQCIPDESESLFDFTRTTRLRKLHMKFKSTSWAFILAFLRNMTQARSNTLQNLSLSCRIPQSGPSQDIDSYYQIPVDLAAMDTVLRHPFFSSLQRIAFGNFFCSFSESDVTNQRLAGKTRFERPDDDSVPGKRLNRAIERLKASFEGSGKAGIVVPVAVEYYRTMNSNKMAILATGTEDVAALREALYDVVILGLAIGAGVVAVMVLLLVLPVGVAVEIPPGNLGPLQ
uniref:F-box domain-containing protein n=1 Tax=Moniliophthora roreri TaxID=221103 RepID=A0A0W0FLV9_MONRR